MAILFWWISALRERRKNQKDEKTLAMELALSSNTQFIDEFVPRNHNKFTLRNIILHWTLLYLITVFKQNPICYI